jgi:hypothetical protein
MQTKAPAPCEDNSLSNRPARPLSVVLTGLAVLAALAAAVLWLRGTGPAAAWVLLAIAVPAARLALSRRYREDVRAWLGRLWGSLDQFPSDKQGSIPWLAVLVFVVIPEGLFCLSSNGLIAAGDSSPAMLTASTLVRHGQFNVDELLEPGGKNLPYYLRPTRIGACSAYPSGMLIFSVPVAMLARAVGADLTDTEVLDKLEKWTASWLAGACLGLFFLLALYVVAPGPAAAVTLLLGVGSAVYSIVGHGLWQHGGVILWTLVFLHVEFRRANRPVPGGTLLQGLACALMFVARPSAALFTMILGGWVLVREPRRAVALVLCAAGAYAPWALLYQYAYETPLGPSVGVSNPDWVRPRATALAGLLFSPSHGLLIYQPWILLAAAPLVPAVRRRMAQAPRARCPVGWDAVCVTIVLLYVGLISAWKMWWGGYCWGSRLLSELTPLLGLLCLKPVAALWQTTTGRRLVLGLALVCFLGLHAPAAYLIQWSRPEPLPMGKAPRARVRPRSYRGVSDA